MERIRAAQYYHARGACYTCLSPDDVVDTSIQIDGEGVLCICRSCVRDMALTAGFDLSDRHAYIEVLEADLSAARARLQEVERELELIAEYGQKVKLAAAGRKAKAKVDA